MDPVKAARDTTHSMTFYNLRADKNPYHQPNRTNQLTKKFLLDIPQKQIPADDTPRTVSFKMTSHSPSPDSLNLVPKLFDLNGISPSNGIQKLNNEYNFEFGGSKKLFSDVTRYSLLKNKPVASLGKIRSPQSEREETELTLDFRQLKTEQSPEPQVDQIGIKKAKPKRFVESVTPVAFKADSQLLTSHAGTKGELLTEGSLNSTRKGRTVSDLKLETYQISEFAETFKDLKTNPNPVYELLMPKDSARRKKVQGVFHDISHLADLKAHSSTTKALQQHLEELQKRTTLAETLDNAVSALDKEPKLSPRRTSENLISSYDNQGKTYANLKNRKSSHFLDSPYILSERRDTDPSAKDKIRDTTINFTRKIKRFGSEDLRVPTEFQRSYPEGLMSKREAKYIKNTKKIYTARNTHQEALNEFSQNNLIASLKKELPNILNGAPSGRAEALILGNWLSTHLNKIKSHPTLYLKDKLHCADEVYNLALNELVRQISCECIERGELFTKIWRNYVVLCEEIVSDARSHFEQRLKQHLDEFDKSKKVLSAQIDLKMNEINWLRQAKDELDLKMEQTEKKVSETELKNLSIQDSNTQMSNHVNAVQNQFKILRREFEDLSYKYNKLRGEVHPHEDDDFDPEEILRLKFEDMMAKQKAREAAERRLDSESESLDEEIPKKSPDKVNYQVNFGEFVGRKIEYNDQETQADPDMVNKKLTDIESQTELMLINPKFDMLFENMQAVENLTKEAQFKREVQEEHVQNLEEDLQEELYEHEYRKIILMAKAKEEAGIDNSHDVSESQLDVSIYDHDLDDKHPKEDNPDTEALNVEQVKESEGNESSDGISIVEVEGETKSIGEQTRIDLEKAFETQILKTDEEVPRKDSDKLEEAPRFCAQEDLIERKENDSLTKESANKELPESNQSSLVKPKKRRKITTQKLQSTPKDDLNSPILETSRELQQGSKENSPTIRRFKTSDVARNLQKKISVKIRESIIRRENVKYDFNGTHKHLKRSSIQEILDENIDDKKLSVEKQEENFVAEKTAKDIVAQKLKYIKLMKLFKVEKAKVAEFEQTTQALTSVINRDGELLQKMKEALGVEDNENIEAIDKNALQKMMKELQNSQYSGDMTKNSQLKNEGISEANESNLRPIINVPLQIRTSLRTPTSSRILDEETKKGDSSISGPRRKIIRAVTMLKTPTAAGTNVFQSPGFTMAINRSLLGRKHEPIALYKKTTNPMTEAMSKLRPELLKNKKPKELMPIKKILKLITSFTLDKISAGRENAAIREQDMASFVYTSLFNIYSLAKLAESKFVAFMTSLKYYSSIHRVAVFMKLCNITNSDQDWTPDEGKQFLAGLDFLLTQQNLGLTIVNSEFEKRHYAPFVRAYEYARQFCEKRNLTQEFADFKKELEQNKENDKGGHNRAGKIKVDLFLEMIVNLYRKFKLKVTEVLRPVFEACNFLNKKHLGRDEITVLVKNLEPEKFDIRRLEEIYAANEEFDSMESFGIPLDKFVVLALENDLFSIEKQRRFINANDDNDVQKNFKQLKEIWEKKKAKLEQIMDFNSKLHEPEIIEFWTKALRTMDRDINSDQNPNAICCVMKYRILVTEINITFSANVRFSE